MKKAVLIIKGYSKTDIELKYDREIIQLYLNFFHSNAGGAFDFPSEIEILEEPDIGSINNLKKLNELDYLIVILIGHGANKNGTQIFQLQKDVFIYPGQIQFKCAKQLYIIESCRDIINLELNITQINKLIPKYKYGGKILPPLTREESLEKFNAAIELSNDGILFLFAADIGESAYNYFFLQKMIDLSIYHHEYSRGRIIGASTIFDLVKDQVINLTEGKQNPLKVGTSDFPFVITIL